VTPSHGGGDSRMSHGSTFDSSSSTARSSRQDEEDDVEGESSRRRCKRNVNEVLQGSAHQESEPEAPPAAYSDDNLNEALPRLNPVQSDDEDAAEAEDEEEAGADEEDAGAENWPHETPVTREEMTSLRELQEATTGAISRLESVFLAKPPGDGEQKRKRHQKRASGNGKRRKERRTRTTSDTASEDEEEAEEGLEGHIRSSSSAILQEALSLLPADKGWKQICEQARDHLFILRPNKHLTFYPSSAAKTWGICAVVDNLPVNYASLALAADKARRVDFNRSLSDWKTGAAGRVRDISLPKLGLFRDERDAKSPWAAPSMRTLARVRDRVGLGDVDAGMISFDTWLNDLQLYLLSNSRDSVSLFDHTSEASLAPPTTRDSATRSEWLTRDAAARLAIRNNLPLAQRAHFGQHKTAKALYDAVVARYSSPAIAALGRLILTYLIPKLSAFATFEDLHLLDTETSVDAIGAARGTPRTHFFEECSPSPLAPSYASAAAVNILGADDVGAASAISGKRRRSNCKDDRSGGSGSGGGGGGGSGGGGSGGSGGGGWGGGSGGNGSGGSRGGAVQRGGSGGGQSVLCAYVIRTGDCAGQTCGKLHSQHRCFSRLDDAWRAEFGEEAECPCWAELLRFGVDIFDLDYGALLAAMYDLSVSAKGDCYRSVPPDPGIKAAALGASESALPGTAPAAALHTFTLDSGASRCFFRDSTTLTPLSRAVPVRLGDPSGGPVLAHSSTVLLCPAVPSGSLLGLHLLLFSTNLVSTAALQDPMVIPTTPGGQRVSICTYTWTTRHLTTFTRRPGSCLYTLATEPPQVAASAQVSASRLVAPPCSCRLLSHKTLLWHSLGNPSLPRLRGMHSHLLASGLPRSLPPLPPSPVPPCLPCVKGPQRAAPHSSSFPPKTAPLKTLHMDMWGPARVSGQDRERYFLPVVDNYTHYTTSVSSSVSGSVRTFLSCVCTLTEVVSSHPTSCGTFVVEGASSSRSRFRPPCIGIVMEVARTSMIHAATPHFLWTFAVRYAAHELNLRPRVSLPETSPKLRWTGKVGDLTVFRPGGTEHEGAEPGGAEFEGAESGGAELRGTASAGGPAARGAGATSLGGARVTAGAGGTGGAGAAVPGGACTRGTGAAGAGGVGGAVAGDPRAGDPRAGDTGAGAGGAGAGDPGIGGARAGGTEAGGGGGGGTGAGDSGAGGSCAGGAGAGGGGDHGAGGVGAGGAGAEGDGAGGNGAGGSVHRGAFFVPPSPSSMSPPESVLCQQDSPLPTPPYAEQTYSFTERREPESHPALPVRVVRTDRCVPRLRPPPVPSIHIMALRPSTVPQRSTAASVLVAELVNVAAACCLDYATSPDP
ncbi:unnamed protein product, partial [Closterium sp. NIES-54]